MTQQILRPDAAGSETALNPNPSSPNYAMVDEESSDGDSTFVESPTQSDYRDLYNLPDPSLPGTINYVRCYIKARATSASVASAATVIKLGATAVEGSLNTMPASYTDYYTEHTTKPGGGSWTWADINNLQAGVRINSFTAKESGRCTQVWVVVDYTSASAIALSLTEGFKAGDTPSRLMTAGLSITEGLKGGDAPGQSSLMTLLSSEGAKLGDALGQSSLMTLLSTEGAKLGDSGVAALTALLGITDGMKAGDSPSQNSLMSLLASEGIKLGDSGLATLTALLGVAEGFKAGDSPGVLANMYPSLSEGIKIGDGLSISIGTQAPSFFAITPVEVTPGTASFWTDVDVSAYVPSGATGVILHLVSTSMYYLGLRKNGSTDARTPYFMSGHAWAMMGVDDSRIFEAYVGNITGIDIYLVGYTKAGVTFFTNSYDKSLSTYSSWQDIDCSAEAPGAIGLIFEVNNNASSYYAVGMRTKGSTDNRTNTIRRRNTFTIIVGCDGNQVCQGYSGISSIDFHLVGYVTAGAVFNTNATDLSLLVSAVWTDLSPLPAGAGMGFIEVVDTTPYSYGLRKNGSSENIYAFADHHPWAIVECDANWLIEGEIQSTNIDFFLVGYALQQTVYTLTISDTFNRGDSLSISVVMPKSITEGLNLGDSVLLNLLGYLTLTDGLKGGDTSTITVAYLLSLLDGLKAGDTESRAMTASKSITDGTKLGDALSRLLTAQVSMTDGAKFGDTALAQLIAGIYYLTLTEGLKAGDSPVQAMLATIQLLEGLKLGDATLFELVGRAIRAWVLAQSYFDVEVEAKSYYDTDVGAKPYYDVTTETGEGE